MIDAVQQSTSSASHVEQSVWPKIQRSSRISKIDEKGKTLTPSNKSAVAILAIKKNEGAWSRLSRKSADKTSVLPSTVAKMRTAKPKHAAGEICTKVDEIVELFIDGRSFNSSDLEDESDEWRRETGRRRRFDFDFYFLRSRTKKRAFGRTIFIVCVLSI